VDNIHTRAGAADTRVALAEEHIGPVVAADKLLALAEARTEPALVMAAGRLAGPGPLQPPERLERHPRVPE
jgi:hypothetical protein